MEDSNLRDFYIHNFSKVARQTTLTIFQFRVLGGFRSHYLQNHNLALFRLSYKHHIYVHYFHMFIVNEHSFILNNLVAVTGFEPASLAYETKLGPSPVYTAIYFVVNKGFEPLSLSSQLSVLSVELIDYMWTIQDSNLGPNHYE